MDNREVALARLAAERHGVVLRSQALASGLPSKSLVHRLETGTFSRLGRGVYLHAAVPLTWEGRLDAALLIGGADAVASHRSAAALHGLRGVPRWRPEITTTAVDHPRTRTVHTHRTNRLDVPDRSVVAGFPCTTVARTLLDLGAVVPYEVVELATQDALIRKLVSTAQLLSVLERIGGRGRRGTASLRAIVRDGLPDERYESELERRLFALLPAGHGLTFQLDVRCIDGRRVRLDSGCPERRLAVEANGHRWHATRKDMERDLARRRSLVASGWSVHEYGWSDVTEHREATRAELRRVVAP